MTGNQHRGVETRGVETRTELVFPVTVDLAVDGTPYSDVGSLPMSVDMNATTTTTITLDNSSPSFGDKVTLTAEVTGNLTGIGTPSGQVDFYDGTMYLGTQTLDSSGMASFTTPPLDLGSIGGGEHDFTVVYRGDDAFDPSTSSATPVYVSGDADSGSPVLSGDSSTSEGDYTLTLPSTVGSDTITEWGIDWGDGTTLTDYVPSPSPLPPHPYGAAGDYTITAVAIGGSGRYEVTKGVTITHAGPSDLTLSVDNATYSGADTEDGGSPAPDFLHGTFVGPESSGPYTVTIDFGDGTTDIPDTTSLTLDPGQVTFDYPLPQYAGSDQYTISATVADADDLSGSTSSPATTVVKYSNVQPTALELAIDSSAAYAGDAGAVLSGSFTDPQSNIPHVVTVNWGDGGATPDITTIDLDPGQTSFTADPHPYYALTSYTIYVTVAGVDGSTGQSTGVTVGAPSALIIHETDDGGLYIITPTAEQTLTIYQDSSTGEVTVASQTFSDVASIKVGLDGGGNTLTVDSGVTLPVVIRGTAGGDTITDNGSGKAEIHGGSDSNEITGGTGVNEVYGGDGDDSIDVSAGQSNWVQGGSGDAFIHGGSGEDWLYGAAGNNTITGGTGHEIIHGGGGTNNLSVDSAGAGDSEIFGGPAGSTNNIQGGPGNDIVYNGPGTMQSLSGGGALDNREIEAYGGANTIADDPSAHWIYDPSTPYDFDYSFNFGGHSGNRLSGDTLQYAVFVRWEPNASWTDKLWFTVHSIDTDGTPITNTIMVDETQAPPHDNSSYEPNDVSWLRLGHAQNGGTDDPTLWPTFIGTAAGGITVDVTTYDPSDPTDKVDGPAYIGAVMVRPLWPTVSIHAEAPVPDAAAGQSDEYRDWLGSSQPTDLPVEAPGVKRVAFDLHASIENIYHTPDELYAVLPDVAGLEFWTAETGGTQLFPDINGNIIDQPLSSGGVYNGTVYVSVDPDGPLATGSDVTVAITEEVQSGGSEVVECQAPALARNGFTEGSWTADFWSGDPNKSVYRGHATANGGGATLRALADDITGNPGDYKLLLDANPGLSFDPRTTAVPDGKKVTVDISPLLRKLETNLRNNVVAAAKSNIFASFPNADQDYSVGEDMDEADVNAVFKHGYDGYLDCWGMATVVMARGLINTLRSGEFDDIFGTTDSLDPRKEDNFIYTSTVELGATKLGDWLYFANDPTYDHEKGMDQGENVIEIQHGKKSSVFAGWCGNRVFARGMMRLTYSGWCAALVKDYNTQKPPPRKQISKVPGYDGKGGVGNGKAMFFDVAAVAEAIFDYRTGASN